MLQYAGGINIIGFHNNHTDIISPILISYILKEDGDGIVIGQCTEYIRIDCKIPDLKAKKQGQTYYHGNYKPSISYDTLY
jgi:hypothetical protein